MNPCIHFQARGRSAALAGRPMACGHLTACSAEEVWWAVEDLWLRLAMYARVHVETRSDSTCIVVAGLAQAYEGAAGDLRAFALDRETYAWRDAGRRGTFVTQVSTRGNDLVLTLSTLRVIEAWPDGPALVWQVAALLLRL